MAQNWLKECNLFYN